MYGLYDQGGTTLEPWERGANSTPHPVQVGEEQMGNDPPPTALTSSVLPAGPPWISTDAAGNLYVYGNLVTGGSLTNPMSGPGDMIIGGGAGVPTRLAAGTAGQVLTMSGGNPTWLPDTASSGGIPGLLYLSGGGTITNTTIANAIASGYTGLFLDPRSVWQMGGCQFTASTPGFTIESRMFGGIGYGGAIYYNTGGYIGTGSGTDGIQVSGQGCTGVVFKNCVFVGSNTNAVIHFGGGQRRCKIDNCLVYNTSTAAGAYAFITDSQITNTNSEDNQFCFSDFAGGYAAIGIGINDVTQHSNDCQWTDVATWGGTYSVVGSAGSNHLFTNYYDRTPLAQTHTATVLCQGSTLAFIGGEDLNPSGGLCYWITSGNLTIISRLISAGGVATFQSDGGNTYFRARTRINGPLVINGGVVDFNDTGVVAGSSFVISGSGGTILLAQNGASPDVTTNSWPGTVTNPVPITVFHSLGNGVATTQTLSYTPPKVNMMFRVCLWIYLQSGTPGGVTAQLAFTGYSGAAFSQNLQLWPGDGSSTAPVFTANVIGTNYTTTFFANTTNTQVPVVLTLTPSGAGMTFRYSYTIDRVF